MKTLEINQKLGTTNENNENESNSWKANENNGNHSESWNPK